jgi:hypothetical protein
MEQTTISFVAVIEDTVSSYRMEGSLETFFQASNSDRPIFPASEAQSGVLLVQTLKVLYFQCSRPDAHGFVRKARVTKKVGHVAEVWSVSAICSARSL